MNDPDEVAASLTAIPEEEAEVPTEQAPDPEPTEAVAAEPQVDHCVECHTDQQTLSIPLILLQKSKAKTKAKVEGDLWLRWSLGKKS